MSTAFKQLSAQPPALLHPDGEFQFGAHRHAGPLLISPSGAYEWSGGALTASGLQALLAFLDAEQRFRCDFLLLGTGAKRLLPLGLEVEADRRGLGLEVMDTAAACRTYNVLMAENRRFLAAFLPL
jgi:uncharacterized protein